METISEVVTGAVALVALGLFGVLVDRKRKHLKRVVRVLDQNDLGMVDFLQQLVNSGELPPAKQS